MSHLLAFFVAVAVVLVASIDAKHLDLADGLRLPCPFFGLHPGGAGQDCHAAISIRL